MSWVKLDNALPRHPKMLGLSCSAKWAYIEALCYCAQYLTDGKMPEGVIEKKDSALLVAAGLFVRDASGGYEVHDYLEYNPSKSDVQKRSNASRSAARMRWASVVQSESDAARMQSALGVGEVLEVDLESKSKESDFDRFWAVYPRREGKIKARQEFDAVTANGGDAASIIAAAERYRDQPDRTPRFTAHPSTWLHQGRWLDELTATETSDFEARLARGRSELEGGTA